MKAESSAVRGRRPRQMTSCDWALRRCKLFLQWEGVTYGQFDVWQAIQEFSSTRLRSVKPDGAKKNLTTMFLSALRLDLGPA